MALLLKFLCVGWTGGAVWYVLRKNGDTLYSNVEKKFNEQLDRSLRQLDIMFISIPRKKAKLFYLSYLIGLFFLSFYLFWPAVGFAALIGCVFVAIGWNFPSKVIHSMFKRRVRKFVLQMVDGLTLMSNAMRSGLNVPQALQIVSDELPNPISQEFALVLSENKLGVTLENALSNLSVRMPNDDIEMFTTSINILKETGGNLAETFDTIANTIRERIKVESKIKAMVSQGVFQGIVVVLVPFALGAVMYSIDPERMRPMFTTLPGWVLLSMMLTLQAIGGWLIWKIVQVRV